MSHENVELARQAYETWNRGDLDWLLNHMTEDFEFWPGLGGLAGSTVRDVIRFYLNQGAETGEVNGPAPTADAAREAVRAHLHSEWEREMPPARPTAALPPGEPPQPPPTESETSERTDCSLGR